MDFAVFAYEENAGSATRMAEVGERWGQEGSASTNQLIGNFHFMTRTEYAFWEQTFFTG